MRLTLVTIRNITNGRDTLAAASCSTPIIMPLSISTAILGVNIGNANKARLTYIMDRN